eukprot:TRINITY_DN93171_c0_g1_i1.p1 TRINITY_DN93171_c0_g1~~TRINITY_DN93171_c0_g1_i1.p1  ORF type:complete len:102 (+),score=13.92 TRINITY_DN93171_c0_g1_i1:616-921(+)
MNISFPNHPHSQERKNGQIGLLQILASKELASFQNGPLPQQLTTSPKVQRRPSKTNNDIKAFQHQSSVFIPFSSWHNERDQDKDRKREPFPLKEQVLKSCT